MGGLMGIQEVPCTSCQRGYGGQHRCEEPRWCACDREYLHLNEAFCRTSGIDFSGTS